MSRKLIGRYLVADDAICHGKPTFCGTRIMVADVLEMIAQGYDWYSIREKWGGAISKEAILEAADMHEWPSWSMLMITWSKLSRREYP